MAKPKQQEGIKKAAGTAKNRRSPAKKSKVQVMVAGERVAKAKLRHAVEEAREHERMLLAKVKAAEERAKKKEMGFRTKLKTMAVALRKATLDLRAQKKIAREELKRVKHREALEHKKRLQNLENKLNKKYEALMAKRAARGRSSKKE